MYVDTKRCGGGEEGRVRNGEEARVGWRAFQAGIYTSCSLRVGRQGGGEKREQG